MAKDYKYEASKIVKKPELADYHPAPVLMMYEWCTDNTGTDTANAIVLLAQRGWLPITQNAVLGGGLSLRKIVIFTIFRKLGKRKRGDFPA